MADSPAPPRLTAGSDDAGPAYAPIDWAAVGSLAVAGLFVLILVVAGGYSWYRKTPFEELWPLLLPAVAVVLAFVARRQIAASEGTRTGVEYANAGWWLAVVAGLGFVAYLLALDFSVRTDAEREFRKWTDLIQQSDPANPADADLTAAAVMTATPAQQSLVRNPRDAAVVEAALLPELLRFRQSDLVRIVGRNKGGRVTFTPQGLREWRQTPADIACTLASTLSTDEGDHLLMVPMRATVDKNVRRWQIAAAPDGYVQARNLNLTRYGWMLQLLEVSGYQFAQAFLTRIGLPGQQSLAYQGYAAANGSPEQMDKELAATPSRLALVGGPGGMLPEPAGYKAALAGDFLVTAAGTPPTADQRDKFLFCWTFGAIRRAGGYLKDGNPEVSPTIQLSADAVRMRVPVEFSLSGADSTIAVARGHLVIQAADPAVAKAVADARAAGGGKSTVPDQDLFPGGVRWRVVRFESDMQKAPPSLQPQAPQGPPGGGM